MDRIMRAYVLNDTESAVNKDKRVIVKRDGKPSEIIYLANINQVALYNSDLLELRLFDYTNIRTKILDYDKFVGMIKMDRDDTEGFSEIFIEPEGFCLTEDLDSDDDGDDFY